MFSKIILLLQVKEFLLNLSVAQSLPTIDCGKVDGYMIQTRPAAFLMHFHLRGQSLSNTFQSALGSGHTQLLVCNFLVAFCFLDGSCQVLILSNQSEFQVAHLHVVILCFHPTRDWVAPIPHLNTTTVNRSHLVSNVIILFTQSSRRLDL